VEFPGIVETDSASIKNPGNTGEWQAASSIGFASAQMPPRARRGQGLKILAREENYIAARHKLPNSQTEWLWDCLTLQVAPAEIFCLCRCSRVFAQRSLSFDSGRGEDFICGPGSLDFTLGRPPARRLNPSRCDGSHSVPPSHSGLGGQSSLDPSKRKHGAHWGVGPKTGRH